MRNRRHENQKAPRQRDVAGDARALLGDGLLGNLHQDLLPRLQQIGNDRQVRGLRRTPRRPTAISRTLSARPASASAASAPSAIAAWLRRSLHRRVVLRPQRAPPLPLLLLRRILRPLLRRSCRRSSTGCDDPDALPAASRPVRLSESASAASPLRTRPDRARPSLW